MRDVEPAGGSAAPGFVVSHWRGVRPLPGSFWLRYVLLTLLPGLALGGLLAWMIVTGEGLRAGSITLLVGWPLLLALNVWATVGAWRSARAHAGRCGSRAWALAAQGMLVLGSLATLAATLFDFAPWAGDGMQWAQGIEPLGQLDMAVSADGRRLRLKGPIGRADAARVQQLLAQTPGLRIVEIESPGGRIAEAERLAAVVRQRALQTRATGYCDGACTLVFLEGSPRHLMPGALLGFHRAPRSSVNPLLDGWAQRTAVSGYRRARLPEGFIARLLSTPPRLTWRPLVEELASSGLTGPLRRTLDVDLPPHAGATLADFAEALQPNATWHALEQRYSGALDTAAARMHAARTAGATDDEVQVEGQRMVEALLPRLLRSAGPALQEQFVALLVDQLQAARSTGPAACDNVLAGDAGARRNLPLPLVERESAWLVVAADEPDNPPRAPTALELEVMRRSLGDAAPARLVNLRAPQPSDGGARACEMALALLRGVLDLPPPQRRLAARLLLERP